MELVELGKRIQALKDVEEIKNLHRDYILAHNKKDWDAMVDCFTDTAKLQVVNDIAKNKKEIANFLFNIVGKNPHAEGAHILIQPVITVNGDTASGHWIMEHFLNVPYGSKNVGWGQGRYYCEYVRDNGKWKFSYLKFMRPWPQGSVMA